MKDFSGEDYRRKLERKMREMIFRKSTNVNEFCNELRSTVKGLYRADDV